MKGTYKGVEFAGSPEEFRELFGFDKKPIKLSNIVEIPKKATKKATKKAMKKAIKVQQEPNKQRRTSSATTKKWNERINKAVDFLNTRKLKVSKARIRHLVGIKSNSTGVKLWPHLKRRGFKITSRFVYPKNITSNKNKGVSDDGRGRIGKAQTKIHQLASEIVKKNPNTPYTEARRLALEKYKMLKKVFKKEK